jgi:hypothetical protein
MNLFAYGKAAFVWSVVCLIWGLAAGQHGLLALVGWIAIALVLVLLLLITVALATHWLFKKVEAELGVAVVMLSLKNDPLTSTERREQQFRQAYEEAQNVPPGRFVRLTWVSSVEPLRRVVRAFWHKS